MRKGMAQGLARPAYYDRNPVARSAGYSVSGAAPNADTVRASYTVPAGKKGFNAAIVGFVQRITAAGAAGRSHVFSRYTPSGGSALVGQMAQLLTNGVGDTAQLPQISLGDILAGDLVELLQGDASTGGTCDFYLLMKVTEFDS